ncbi:MAG: Smr/MutS family protein [Gemmatimonadota bacterium]
MGKRKKKRQAGQLPEFGFFGDLLDATPVATLDLHGDTALEAERRVKDFVATHARISRGKVLHIITGRGRGSPGRAVLPGAVRKALTSETSRFVEEFDRDLDEAGFLVRLR